MNALQGESSTSDGVPVFAYSEHGSLSFNTYDEFIREVERELEREGHTDYYFCM